MPRQVCRHFFDKTLVLSASWRGIRVRISSIMFWGRVLMKSDFSFRVLVGG
ncbi:hypothetical protein HanXRQr2_Chr16g0773201 [Helianthus annuus]|uniref:Uncharacterized protein n=1 Tax=Helianthus annuus TaxID=4232 RepID=A0A9K3H2C4_HELAN|nr:hypothetical protein HanXRQr2_Chr16g0773201 [Helianthus annuus]